MNPEDEICPHMPDVMVDCRECDSRDGADCLYRPAVTVDRDGRETVVWHKAGDVVAEEGA